MESSEVERELEELETRIERLRALYEQYFMGIERLEPLIPRKEVDRRVWVLRREQIRNTGLRFKFQMLIQRYNTFQQYWGRVAREIENGTYRRDVVRAAKRVGAHEALTIVGRKRAERYAMLAEQRDAPAEGSAPASPEHGDVDEDAVTLRPPRGSDVAARDSVHPPPVLPPVDVAAFEASPPPPPSRPAPTPLAALAPPPAPAATAPVKPAPLGMPWGLGIPKPRPEAPPAQPSSPGARAPAPSSPGAAGAPARKRVAELAAEMRAQRAQGGAAKPDAAPSSPGLATTPEVGGAGEARLPPAPTPAARPPVPPAVRSAAPAHAAAAPAPAAVAPPEPASTKRRSSVRPEDPGGARKRRSSPPPSDDAGAASGVRHPTQRRSSKPPRGAEAVARSAPDTAARTKPAAPVQRAAPRDDELPEQRLRQIYAKFVETKRAANESTAGVTYERLAESLREQAAKLRATNPAKSIDYDVVVKNGKTLLKPIIK